MANYKVKFTPTGNSRQHIYFGEARTAGGTTDRRFFIRTIIHHTDLMSHEASVEYWSFEAERVIVEALAALEVARTERQYEGADCNHIFLNFLPTITMACDQVTAFIMRVLMKHGPHFYKLRITDGEVLANVRENAQGEVRRVRWLIHNEAGFIQTNTLRIYQESPSKRLLEPTCGTTGEPLALGEPYPLTSAQQRKRYLAQSRGTCYVHDLPAMFSKAIARAWSKRGATPPAELLTVQELIVENDKLVPVNRPPGSNAVGMLPFGSSFLSVCPYSR